MTSTTTHQPDLLPSDLRVGQRVQTYDGPGVVETIEADSFYGGGADGYRYDVRLDADGRLGSYDRTRVL